MYFRGVYSPNDALRVVDSTFGQSISYHIDESYNYGNNYSYGDDSSSHRLILTLLLISEHLC